jgi:hypothetical protein
MAKITRYVCVGNYWIFTLMCLTIVGIPGAILYLVNTTMAIEDEVEDPDEYVEFVRGSRRRH